MYHRIGALCTLVCLLTFVTMVTALESMKIRECPRHISSSGEYLGCRMEPEDHPYVFNCSRQGLKSMANITQGVEVVDFSDNMIMCVPKVNDTMTTCSLRNCSGCIRELHLEKNNLTYLHDEAFSDLICLQSLDLSKNSITMAALSKNMFNRLHNMHHLDLSDNPLGEAQDRVFNFVSMPKLMSLNLSSCRLRQLEPLSIDDFPYLEVLDLSSNSLTDLPQQAFQGLSSLQVLDLSRNRLTTIGDLMFGDLTNLKVLRLSNNQLHVISDSAFFGETILDRLLLNNNKFKVVPVRSLQKLRHLQFLDMSQNPIETLKREPYMLSVEAIVLDNLQGFTTIEMGAFSTFSGLRSLSLRFCGSLRTITEGAFQGNISLLREVRLDHNGLTTLSANLLPWEQLAILTLHDNPWTCDCSLEWAAGRLVANTTMRCQSPLRLRGHEMLSTKRTQLSCARPLTLFKVMVGLTLTSMCLSVLGVVLWFRRLKMPCACLRGERGQYVTVYTKEGAGDGDGDGDGESNFGYSGEPEDLDLGCRSRGGGGRVQILTKTAQYQRLQTKPTESTQDLVEVQEEL